MFCVYYPYIALLQVVPVTKSFPKKGKQSEGGSADQNNENGAAGGGKGKKTAGQPLVKHCDGALWTSYQVWEIYFLNDVT